MPIANTYNPNPSTVDNLLRKRQTQVDLGREQGLIKEEAEKPEPFKPFGVEQTPDYKSKTLGRKITEDAALLAYSIPVGIAQIATHPIQFLKEAPGAIIQSVKDVVDPNYYKAHPLLGVVNLAGFVAPIAGAGKSAAIKTAMRTALNTGIKEAVTLGVEETVVRSALSIGMKEVGGVLLKKGALGNAIWQVAKTGKVEIVTEIAKNLLSKAGIADDIALRVASEISNNLYTTFSRQTTKMKVLESIAHPVGSTAKYITGKVDPLRKMLFGSPSETAVAKLYGSETVAKNPEGFIAIERWAEAQLKEQGLENSVANRQRIMQNWVEQNSQWAALTPEERVAHFKNYAESDLTRLAIHEATGIDIVTVKALPQNYVDAMVETLKEAPADFDVPKLMALMEDTYGRDFTNHSAEINKTLLKGKTNVLNLASNTKEELINVISKLGDSRSTVSFTKFSPEVQTLADELEKTGYRIGHAPTQKPISFAADIFEGAVPKVLPTEDIEIGVTSFRGKPVATVKETVSYYESTRAKGFEKSLKEAKGNKVKIYSVKKTAGSWEGNVEPSFIVKAKGTREEWQKYAAQHGIKGNQDAVIAFKPGEGNGAKYIFKELTDPDKALKEAHALGISGATIDSKNLIIYDGSGAWIKSVKELSVKLDNKPIKTNGTVTLITKQEYPNILAGGRSGANLHPDLISRDGKAISISATQAKRTAFGNWIERLGLSPSGIIEGAAEFSYRENFTQGILGDFAKKYGSIVKAKSISSAGQVSIPIEKLFEWLDKNKAVIRGVREKYTLPVRTVFDLKEADLIRAGFKADIAADIVGISKKALIEVPTSVVGMGDKVVNFLRTRNKRYNSWMSSVYDTYLKAAYRGRYDLSPFFSAQEFVETKLNSALFLKDPSLLAGGRTVQKIGAWTAERLGKKLEGTATYLRKIIEQPPLNEVVAVRDEILGTLQKTMLDYTSSPDIIGIQNTAMGIKGLASEAAFEQSIKSRNLWFAITGQSSVRMATTFNKALANKFGMTLESALDFTMEEGVKKYRNPQMIQLMREATQEVFHYKPGFLTSPLIKTMNIIWFPFRFEAKTVSLLSKYVSNLSPASRLVVLNNWVHFANWAGTDEGIEWRRTNRNMFYNILSYVTAYEQMGQGLEAVSKGRFFGGNAGLIGAVPFGFVVNLARELAVLPEDKDQFDPKTGKRFTKQIPRELISAATFANALEQLMISVSPSTPFYSLTGGIIGGVSPRKIYESLVRQVVGAGKGIIEGRDPARGRQMLERDFKRVPLDYNRFAQ